MAGKVSHKMAGQGGVRIIAGAFRGRRLVVPTATSLRPTPGMLRETLFNWLQVHIQDARCLDLCAGSGALGFEALSRGAAHATFVERSAQVAAVIEANAASLGLLAVDVHAGDARLIVERLAARLPQEVYDIVFLDPPFDQPELMRQLVAVLLEGGLVRPGGFLYVEGPARSAMLAEPRLRLHRQSHCGRSQGSLYAVDG